MAYQLNEKLQQLAPYKVISEDCKIRLDANESFIDPGEELKEKLLAAWSGIPLNRYPEDSYRELRQAFAQYHGLDPELVVAGNGSDELISLLIGSFLKSDDKLLLTEPDFSMYSVFASAYEKQVCFTGRKGNGDLDVAVVRDKIQEENVTMLLFSNPSSAYSTVMPVEKILELADGTDALVVVDEAYMDFSDQSVIGHAASRGNLLVLRTCSKALSCAGIRLGFATGPEKVMNVLKALRAPYNLNTLTETAGRIVLSEPGYIKNAVEKILENREELYTELKALESDSGIKKVHRSATNYICVETDCAGEIYEKLKARSILVRNLGNMLRITAGTKEENRAAAEGLRIILAEMEGEIEDEGK